VPFQSGLRPVLINSGVIMAKLDYEYDNDNGSSERRQNSFFRFAGIFAVLLCIVGALIYFMWPSPKTSAAANGSATPDGKNNVISKVDEPQELKAPGDSVLPVAPKENAGAGNQETAPAADPAMAANETPTAEPEKGKPWVHDPKVDEPQRVTDPTDITAPLVAIESAVSSGDRATATALIRDNLAKVRPGSDNYRKLAAQLTKLNLAAYFDGSLGEVYVVKSGDNLSRIANHFNMPIDGIKAVNHLSADSDIVKLNQKLSVCPGKWSIVVDKSARLLKLSFNDRLFAVFDVGIGRLNSTPEAKFVISDKLKNPTWYGPRGEIVKFGDPGNPLGTRFMKLAAAGSPDKPITGYGIHGTNDEDSVTKSRSQGCIRMYNKDAEALFMMVPGGTPVEIVEQEK